MNMKGHINKAIDVTDEETKKLFKEKFEIILQIGKENETIGVDSYSQNVRQANCSENIDSNVNGVAMSPCLTIEPVQQHDNGVKKINYTNGNLTNRHQSIVEGDLNAGRKSAIFTTKTPMCNGEVGNARSNEVDSELNATYNKRTNGKVNSIHDSERSTTEDPTSGRKWIVLIGAFSSIVLSTGFPFNMSVLYGEWLQEFGKSNSETSLIQSVCTGLYLIGGFVSGIIVMKYGPRRCGAIGGLLVAVGLAVSYLASSITHLVLSIGVVSGLGFSLAYVAASTTVGMYFTGKARVMALAFVSFGSGCGASVFPVMLDGLVIKYGWRGTVLLVAGIMLHLIVIACIFKPPVPPNGNKRIIGDRKQSMSHISEDLDTKITDTIQKGYNVENPTENMNNNVGEGKLRRVSFSTTELRRMYEVEEERIGEKTVFQILKTIFKNKIFIGYCFAQALCIASLNSVLIFFIDYYQFKGLSRSDAVTIYFYMNVVSTAFRIFPGILKQLRHVSVLSIPAFSSLIGCASMAVFPITGSSFTLNLVAACGYGLAIGGMVTVISISIVKLVGPEYYSAGLGISMTITGIFNAAAGPISGFIRDTTGNYDASFFTAASSLFLSSVLFFIIMGCRHYSNRDKGSRFDFEMIIRRKSRRRSSLIPWRRKSIDIHL